MSPLGPPWILHLGLPDPGSNIPQRRRDRTNSLPQGELSHRKRQAVIAPLLTGTGIAAALGTGTGGISTTAHFYRKLSQELNEDMEQVVESFVSIQRQINSLASVALQNRHTLGLLTAEKGGTCLFLGEGCCYFVHETGIVQGRGKELRDRIELRRKELHSPKPIPVGPPLVAPSLGTTGTCHCIPLIWTLSLQSLSKVSPRMDSGYLSRPGQDHSSREPHPDLRKRRPWALGRSSVPGTEPLPLSSRK